MKKEKTYSQAKRVIKIMHGNSQSAKLKYTLLNLYLNNNEKIHVNIYI